VLDRATGLAYEWAVGSGIEPVSRSKTGSIDLVQLRDVLLEIASRGESEPLLEVAIGLLTQCKDVIEGQAYEIALLRKQLFGRRSEKVSPDQLHLFEALLQSVSSEAASAAAPESAPAPEDHGPKKKRKPQKRRPLEPTKTLEIAVPDSERACPTCGEQRCVIGHERRLLIEYTPPKIDVIEILREKVACKPCEGEILLAPQPLEKVIERAAPGPRLLAALAVHKHVDGLPLHRSRRIFARSGLSIAVQTLNRWEEYAHQLAQPVIERIRDGTLRCDTINLDDTGLRVRDRTGEHGAARGHIWVFVGRSYDPSGDLTKTTELVSYLYAPTWHAKYPEEFLREFKGALQGDAYKGYDRIAGSETAAVKNLLAGCMMHARRPFTRALQLGDPLAVPFLDAFRELYRIEKQAKEDGLRADDRLALRHAQSLPILGQLRSRADALSPLPLGKPMREGVRYLENQWDKLRVPFERDGRLEIDNGVAERALRRLASGRRAWLFAGAESGAHRIAGMLSLVSTADAAAVDPGSYLTDLFRKLAGGWPQRRIDDLLPHRWPTIEEREQ
jgi:transposase